MTLFQWGKFTSHSGSPLDWKAECDALTDDDWDCLARLVADRAGAFGSAVGVPKGGLKFAEALNRHRTQGANLVLIVDDVLTTGKSMDAERANLPNDVVCQGIVLFSRVNIIPYWITPIFRLCWPFEDRR